MEKVCAYCVSGWSIARGPAPGAGGFGAASPGRYTAADLAGLVVVRRQLWLSQARVPDADKAALLDAPISPGHTFGQAVEDILQKSLRDREASRQVAALLPPCTPAWNRSSLWRAPMTQTVTRTVPVPTAPRGDLRHRLQGNRAQPAGKGNAGRGQSTYQRLRGRPQGQRVTRSPQTTEPQQPQQGP
ncbi:UNVERIFIED_CONTAM: hypothetical protein FKN15_055175 [Acipenser sinensis]